MIQRLSRNWPTWKATRQAAAFLSGMMILALLAWGGPAALARLEDRLNTHLLTRHPEAQVEFVDLPEGLVALAGGDLRESISELLKPPWTQDDRCREMARCLSDVGWIGQVDSVLRTPAGRFEVRARYRLPVAMVASGDDYYLVDDQGVRLPGIYVYHPRWYVIDGVESPLPRVGNRWSGEDIEAGLAVLAVIRPEPFRHQIVGVDVANFKGRRNARGSHVELLTDRPGGRIRWGSAPGFEVEENHPPQKLALLRQNYLQSGRADAGHTVIDISTFPDRFHVPG